ncbi:MAG: alanine dehydrogenase [Chloroflexota bacterium]
MLVGIPREIKDNENRVSTTPAGVAEYVARGHSVIVEAGAGQGSGFEDSEYAAAGAELIESSTEVWAKADMIVKVKEPIAPEYDLMRDGQILYTYLHLAAEEALTTALVEQGVTAIAYETVELEDGSLPLLSPMSEVAGRMATQVGAFYLAKPSGGRGKLIGGVPGVAPADVVIIGGGIVGTNAAQMALGMGANVTILDISIDRLRYLDQVLHGRIVTLASNRSAVAEAAANCDLLIGGVLIPGAKAPKLVTADVISTMRPGAVVVDVAIDQGGCVETARPTSHSNPTYIVDDVVHYCVTNMPGAMPRTSTFALSNVTLPYGLKLADRGVDALRNDVALRKGLNVYKGNVTYEAVAEAFGRPYVPAESLLN